MNCFVVSFHSTTQALMMQAMASREGLPGRMIPAPPTMSARCDIAWAVPQEYEQDIRDAISRHGIQIGVAVTMRYFRARCGDYAKRKPPKVYASAHHI